MKTSGVRFGIRSKLIISFGFIIILLALVSASAYISLVQVDTRVDELFDTYVEFSQLTRETENKRVQIQASEKDLLLQYVLQGIDAALTTGDSTRTTLNAIRDNLKAMQKVRVDASTQRKINDLLKTVASYEESLSRLETSLRQQTPEENTPASRADTVDMVIEKNFAEQGSNNDLEKIKLVLAECAVTAR